MKFSKKIKKGLKKLIEATESVNQLSKELLVKEKDLAVANVKAEEVLKNVKYLIFFLTCFYLYIFIFKKGNTTTTSSRKSQNSSTKSQR